MTEFIDALNALDVEHMSRCFTADVTAFVPAAQDGLVDGRAALTDVFRRFADRVRPTTPRLGLVPQDVRVQQGGDLAVVTFQIVEAAPRVTRRRTFVFRREGGRWLISHMHASDLVPPLPSTPPTAPSSGRRAPRGAHRDGRMKQIQGAP